MTYYEVLLGKAVGKGASILTYASSAPLFVGAVVEVPLMRGRAPGVVVKKVAQPTFRCKETTRVLYSKPLPAHLVEVAGWISQYYAAPASSVMQMILPNGVLKKRKTTGVGGKTEQKPGFTEQTEQQGVARNSVSSTRLRRPVVTGGAALESSPLVGYGLGGTISEPTSADIPLNPAQKKALEGLQKAPGATRLLLGVTGSGKTNIYLTEALRALSGQKSVVLLVPEIALTGQLVQVFQSVFGERVVVIHSRQTEVERQRIFEKLLLSDTPQIVIGPRSALFAPLSDLGLIIIDEEHEGTYYQENTPKYSAIRVASHIAERLKIPCILGSATPAVEDFFLARARGSLVELTEKAKKTAVKPTVKIVDFKNRDSFRKNRYFCNDLLKSIERNLAERRQTLIFHNRRGSSPLTICDNCGNELLCPNCYLPLTLHVDAYEMQCHTCGYKCRVPSKCPSCGGVGLIHKGFGTKLLESELARLFPEARVRRFDADNKKGESLDAVYAAVRSGEVDILVGTQTLAKGLDLPLLSTVGVVSADTGLSLPDYAAEERVFQLLTQVMGRVGRGHSARAEVYVQTYQPEHPVLAFAVNEDYLGFSEYLLDKRRRSGFPPFAFVAKAAVTAKTEATALRKARKAYSLLSRDGRLKVSPPCPAFHERTVRGFTWELTVRATSRRRLAEALASLGADFHVALDPPSLL